MSITIPKTIRLATPAAHHLRTNEAAKAVPDIGSAHMQILINQVNGFTVAANTKTPPTTN